jgi:hypothetical protein
MSTQDKQDKFIRELFHKKDTEKAPDHFTEKVMGRIASNPAIDNSPLLSTGSWIAIISGVAAIIIMVFLVDMPFLDRIFTSTGIQKVSMNFFSQGFINYLSGIFSSLNISSISGMIVMAVGGLLIIDRLLRRRYTGAGVVLI